MVEDETVGLDLAITVEVTGHVVSRPGFASRLTGPRGAADGRT